MNPNSFSEAMKNRSDFELVKILIRKEEYQAEAAEAAELEFNTRKIPEKAKKKLELLAHKSIESHDVINIFTDIVDTVKNDFQPEEPSDSDLLTFAQSVTGKKTAKKKAKKVVSAPLEDYWKVLLVLFPLIFKGYGLFMSALKTDARSVEIRKYRMYGYFLYAGLMLLAILVVLIISTLNP